MRPSISQLEDAARLLLSEPRATANVLLGMGSKEVDRLRTLLERREASPLADIERAWQLTSAQAATIFGVSRQAYAKWKITGVPASRIREVSHLAESTRLLTEAVARSTHVAAAVRQLHERLNDRSLLDLARSREFERLRQAIHQVVHHDTHTNETTSKPNHEQESN